MNAVRADAVECDVLPDSGLETSRQAGRSVHLTCGCIKHACPFMYGMCPFMECYACPGAHIELVVSQVLADAPFVVI